MTVCIVALSGGGAPFIVGAADTMITAGDTKFEPHSLHPNKVVPITNSLCAMIAGNDMTIPFEVLGRVGRDVNQRIVAEPDHWWTVKEVVDLYIRHYKNVVFERAETAILAPLGMTNAEFLIAQSQMAPSLVTQLATELLNFSAPHVSVIICGTDPTGTHIYVVHDATYFCHDGVGFAAIGSGASHADSQFMLAGHSRAEPIPETLLLTYVAKRSAEVAPGVGEGTVMFTIGQALGSFAWTDPTLLMELEKIYNKRRRAEQNAIKTAERGINNYVTEIVRKAIEQQQKKPPENDGGAAPPAPPNPDAPAG